MKGKPWVGAWMVVAIAGLAVLPAPAAAESVVIGRPSLNVTPSETVPGMSCSMNPSSCAWTAGINTSVSGGTLSSPADGRVTAVRAVGNRTGVGTIYINVARPAGNGSFLLTATMSPSALDGSTNTIASPPEIRVGDTITASVANPPYNMANPGSANLNAVANVGDEWRYFNGLQAGSTGSPTTPPNPNQSLLFNATVELDRPRVNSISPQSGPESGGTTVTITGEHLSVATGVSFGGVPAESFSGNNTTITAVAPPHAPGNADIQVTTAGGASILDQSTRFTYELVDNGLLPVVEAITFEPKQFLPGNLGGSIIPLRATQIGTTVSYSLSEPANVVFTATRVSKGRLVKGKCVKKTKKNRKKPKCTREVPVAGSFAHDGAAGANQFGFSGRMDNKALKPGNYLLNAVATDVFGSVSTPAQTPFKIAKPKKPKKPKN